LNLSKLQNAETWTKTKKSVKLVTPHKLLLDLMFTGLMPTPTALDLLPGTPTTPDPTTLDPHPGTLTTLDLPITPDPMLLGTPTTLTTLAVAGPPNPNPPMETFELPLLAVT